MRPILAATDNLLFLLIFVVVTIVRVLASRKGNKKEEPPRRTSTPQSQPQTPIRPAEETDTDRMRKFLEALGQPPGSAPPPPVRPREVPPPLPQIQPPAQPERPRQIPQPRPIYGNPWPPLTTAPPPVAKTPRRVTSPRPVQPASVPTAAPPGPAEATSQHGQQEAALQKLFEVSPDSYGVVTQGPAAVSQTKSDLAALLATPDGLRRAIILREIFGPPRSLQPFDLVGSA